MILQQTLFSYVHQEFMFSIPLEAYNEMKMSVWKICANVLNIACQWVVVRKTIILHHISRKLCFPKLSVSTVHGGLGRAM